MAETQAPQASSVTSREPINSNPAWGDLVDDFSKGGLTPAQYAAFALAGIFIILLASTTVLAVYSTRRANSIEAESAMAAIGRWKDAERDIVKSVPEPPRLHKLSGGGGRKGVMAHMRRYSEEGRKRLAGGGVDNHPLNTKRGRERARSRSVDKGRHGMF